MNENLVLRQKSITLFEVLDRILYKGIVIKGNLMISVADVNLIYVSIQAIITSIDRVYEVSE